MSRLLRAKARSLLAALLLASAGAACGGASTAGGGSRGSGSSGETSTTSPDLSGCAIFPASNPWNTDVGGYGLDGHSAAWVASMGGSSPFHPDFGTQYGIPYITADASTPPASVDFAAGAAGESDPGPYPIPANAPVESGSDQHVLVVDTATCKLYELDEAVQDGATSWSAYSGAVFDLASNDLRPLHWTSADAAGLPILPGLARYDEVAAGAIHHALRFTASRTQKGFITPARHAAGSTTDAGVPPMGARARLKAGTDLSKLGPQALVVAHALQRYGMILADNGSSWFVTGAPDARWDDDDLDTLKTLRGSDFEFVYTGAVTAQ